MGESGRYLGLRARDFTNWNPDGTLNTDAHQGLSTRIDGKYQDHQLKDPEFSLDTSKLPDNLTVRVNPNDPGHPLIGLAPGVRMTEPEINAARQGTQDRWVEVIDGGGRGD